MPEIGFLEGHTYIISHISGDRKSKSRGQRVWFFQTGVKEACVPGLSPWLVEMAETPLHLFPVFSLYEGVYAHISPFNVGTGHFVFGVILMKAV